MNAAGTCFGVLIVALFPTALPVLVLTAAFSAPLVVLGLVAALPVALVAGLVLAIRRAVRYLAGATERRGGKSAGRSAASTW